MWWRDLLNKSPKFSKIDYLSLPPPYKKKDGENPPANILKSLNRHPQNSARNFELVCFFPVEIPPKSLIYRSFERYPPLFFPPSLPIPSSKSVDRASSCATSIFNVLHRLSLVWSDSVDEAAYVKEVRRYLILWKLSKRCPLFRLHSRSTRIWPRSYSWDDRPHSHPRFYFAIGITNFIYILSPKTALVVNIIPFFSEYCCYFYVYSLHYPSRQKNERKSQ